MDNKLGKEYEEWLDELEKTLPPLPTKEETDEQNTNSTEDLREIGSLRR